MYSSESLPNFLSFNSVFSGRQNTYLHKCGQTNHSCGLKQSWKVIYLKPLLTTSLWFLL